MEGEGRLWESGGAKARQQRGGAALGAGHGLEARVSEVQDGGCRKGTITELWGAGTGPTNKGQDTEGREGQQHKPRPKVKYRARLWKTGRNSKWAAAARA